MEDSMNSIIRLVAVVAGLVLLQNVTPSWGGTTPSCQPPGCNPTVSDTNSNTAGGTGALQNVLPGPTGGLNNTAFGDTALLGNTTGDNNTASGVDALLSNTTGSSNTASGVDALLSNTTGSNNTASGVGALLSNTTGHSNTASGINALFNNTTGIDNTATGGGSLLGNSTGSKNTAIGVAALNQSTGNKNIGIGFQAGLTLTTGNNNIFIGNQGAGDESQTIRVGSAQTRTFVAGINTTNMSGIGELVAIDPATGQLGFAAASSARYKQDISPMGVRSEGLLQLRPVTFAYKDDAQATMHYGLVAEEVAAVYPQLVTYAPTGEVRTVRYQELIPMLLNELQRQQRELAELRALVGQGRETTSLSR